MSEDRHQLRLLEALLFAAPAPLAADDLAARLGDAADVAALLQELAESYAERGVNLVRLAGGWTFRTAPDLASLLKSERVVPRRLSRAALDRLMEAGWVRPLGRRDSPGRPLNWVTTPAFLAHFGLDGLNALPGIDELRAAGLLDIGPAVLGEAAELVVEEAEADEFDD